MEKRLVQQLINGASKYQRFGIAAASTRFLRTSATQRSAETTCSEAAPLWSLKGKRAFVAGVADDQGYGCAVAYALANAGAELVFGVWPPVLNIFSMAWKNGKYNKSRKLANGKMLEIAKVYPLDAAYDTLDEVPPEVRKERRYAALNAFTISDVAALVKKDFGKIDLLVHSLANGPEVKNLLHETSRAGYLSAISTSAYSNVSLLRNFGPLMPPGGASVSLTYIASERVVPGYGGGMSTAKAALESDTRVLAWELGRKYGIRVNTISAGGLRSRAARAIGFIDAMVSYSKTNAPLTKDLTPSEVGQAALFLLSPAGSAVTGHTLYVDNGLHAMGLAVDSPAVSYLYAQEAAKKGQ